MMFKAVTLLAVSLAGTSAIQYSFTGGIKTPGAEEMIFNAVAPGINARVGYGPAQGDDVYVASYDLPKTRTGSEEALQPRLEGIPQDSTQYMELHISFFRDDGEVHNYANNFTVCLVDLDGTTNTDDRGSYEIAQFIEPEPASWYTERTTALTVTENPVRFEGAYHAESGIDTTASHAIGCAVFESEDHVHMKIGYRRNSNSFNTYRLFSINFFDNIEFEDEVDSSQLTKSLYEKVGGSGEDAFICDKQGCRKNNIGSRHDWEPVDNDAVPHGDMMEIPHTFATDDGVWTADSDKVLFTSFDNKRTNKFPWECACDDGTTYSIPMAEGIVRQMDDMGEWLD